jgi:hypothetical protein
MPSLGDSSFSSQALNFEGTVVAIEDYYYDDRMKSIEKRSNKRKRGEATKSKSSAGRVVEWKVGPDPEENVVQESSSLHDFTGLNASSVLEVTKFLKHDQDQDHRVGRIIEKCERRTHFRVRESHESG